MYYPNFTKIIPYVELVKNFHTPQLHLPSLNKSYQVFKLTNEKILYHFKWTYRNTLILESCNRYIITLMLHQIFMYSVEVMLAAG